MKASVTDNAGQRAPEAFVHCPMCTHTVPAAITYAGKRIGVVAGQKCPRCRASLDVAALVYVRHAA